MLSPIATESKGSTNANSRAAAATPRMRMQHGSVGFTTFVAIWLVIVLHACYVQEVVAFAFAGWPQNCRSATTPAMTGWGTAKSVARLSCRKSLFLHNLESNLNEFPCESPDELPVFQRRNNGQAAKVTGPRKPDSTTASQTELDKTSADSEAIHEEMGERRTSNDVLSTTGSPATIPNHIAFVCDGNARWARQRNLPIAAGHAAGADRLVKLIETLGDMDGVNYATFYAFSSENWKRSETEIQHIFTLMERTAKSMVRRHKESSIAIRIIGDLQDPRIPASLRSALVKLEEKSQGSPSIRLTVSIAVNYSARNDMVQAVRAIAREGMAPDDIIQEEIRKRLSTRDLPDPDLIVRTSGENRLSNWLLWEAAYAEFYVSNVHWPDFDATALKDALGSYSQRQRRYGGRVE